ncbi:hypothetical protein QAD02_014087 [Eretmocerus hayati]|uniref:Uncharacterized protein n=1 Tax=Eretmocerus hayati TaxID=131215 RepID=A0ACC2P943_9HYME|nr:hypothetical protein QAD02_014087 [Eretmocerus hayati]
MQSEKSFSCAVILIKKDIGKFPSDMMMKIPIRFLEPPDENNQRCVRLLEGPHKPQDLALIKGIMSSNAPIPEAWKPLKCNVLKYCRQLIFYGFYVFLETPAEATNYMNERFEANQEKNKNNTSSEPKKQSVQASLLAVPPLVQKPPITSRAVVESTPLQIPEELDPPEPSREETVPSGGTANDDTSSEHTLISNYQPDQTSTMQETTVDAIVKSVSRELNNKMTDLTNYIRTKLPGLESKVNVIEQDVSELRTFVMEQRKLAFNENILTYNDFIKKYNLKLPMESKEEFHTFNEELVTRHPETNEVISDSDMFKDLTTHIVTTAVSRTDALLYCRYLFKKFTKKQYWTTVLQKIKALKEIKKF